MKGFNTLKNCQKRWVSMFMLGVAVVTDLILSRVERKWCTVTCMVYLSCICCCCQGDKSFPVGALYAGKQVNCQLAYSFPQCSSARGSSSGSVEIAWTYSRNLWEVFFHRNCRNNHNRFNGAFAVLLVGLAQLVEDRNDQLIFNWLGASWECAPIQSECHVLKFANVSIVKGLFYRRCFYWKQNLIKNLSDEY